MPFSFVFVCFLFLKKSCSDHQIIPHYPTPLCSACSPSVSNQRWLTDEITECCFDHFFPQFFSFNVMYDLLEADIASFRIRVWCRLDIEQLSTHKYHHPDGANNWGTEWKDSLKPIHVWMTRAKSPFHFVFIVVCDVFRTGKCLFLFIFIFFYVRIEFNGWLDLSWWSFKVGWFQIAGLRLSEVLIRTLWITKYWTVSFYSSWMHYTGDLLFWM